MSRATEQVAAEPPSRALKDTLTQRYDTTYQAWVRQDAAMQAMRDTADSSPGNEVDRTGIHVQLDERAALADLFPAATHRVARQQRREDR